MSSIVQQSGLITIGHLVKWTAPGVIADAGPPQTLQRVLAYIQGADFNSIQDQPLIVPNTVTAFRLNAIIVTNASVPITTAAGGFYTGFSKSGSIVVAAAQVYAALTGPDILITSTLTAFAASARFSARNLTNGQIMLSLTTPQGVPCFADVYLVGSDLSINPASF